MWRAPIRFVGHAGVCIYIYIYIYIHIYILITCQATPQPKPRHTPRTRHSPVGGLQLHVSTHAPNPSPTIPHGLRTFKSLINPFLSENCIYSLCIH
ncbi:hypothetical protein Hanom_Chr03g00246281 [Helianthus anomalus]